MSSKDGKEKVYNYKLFTCESQVTILDGVAIESQVIRLDGVAIDSKETTRILNKLVNVLAFYGDATTYHAISLFPDPPCGDFIYDFGENPDYDYDKPGMRARELIAELFKTVERNNNV